MRRQRFHLNLSESDRKLLEDTLRRAVRVAQTEVALTHPSNPVYDRYRDSEGRLRTLLGRVRR